MSNRKQIEQDSWQDRLQTFTSGNRGRTSAIATEGMTVVENKPLVSVDYDPVGKGDDMIISVEGMTHTVNSPKEMYIIEESNGVVSTMEIVDKKGNITYLRLM